MSCFLKDAQSIVTRLSVMKPFYKTPSVIIKIGGFFIIVVAIMLVAGIVTYKTLSKLTKTVTYVTEPKIKLSKLKSIMYDLAEAESAVRAFSITRDESYLSPYYYLIVSMDDKINDLRAYCSGKPDQQQTIDSIGDLIGEKILVLNGFIDIEKNTNVTKSLQGIITKIETEEKQAQKSAQASSQINATEATNIKTQAEKKIVDASENSNESNKKSIWKKLGSILKREEKSEAKNQKEDSAKMKNSDIKNNSQKKNDSKTIAADTSTKNKFPAITTQAIKKDIQKMMRELENQYSERVGQHKTELILLDKKTMDKISMFAKKLELDEEAISKKRASESQDTAEFTIRLFVGIGLFSIALLILFAILIFNDIKKTNRHREQLMYANIQIEKNAKTKEEFLANISHEIRTPMNSIVGFTEQMTKTPLNKQQRIFLTNIEHSSEHLLYIISDLLDLSKITAGKLVVESINFKPAEIIAEAEEIMKPLADKKNLKLISYIPSNLSRVLIGDPLRLRQVLINLIGNSVKFTEEGSVEVKCSVINDEEYVQVIKIDVIDTGIGIPKDKMSEIFKEFSQADASITRRYGGTGLGLSLCKRLMEIQNGSISVESTEGKGSVFSINITYKKGGEYDMPSDNQYHYMDFTLLKGLSVLVAYDEQYNQLLAKTILENHGLNVEIAADGKEAIEKMKKNDYDLILMDVQMPVMSGTEAVQHIRKNIPGKKSHIPVIAVTANALKGDSEKYINAGMTDCLVKPFRENELLSKIFSLTIKHFNPRSLDNNCEKTDSESHPSAQNFYNLKNLEDLANGNNEFFVNMINIFINHAKSGIEKMNTALEQGNVKEVAAIAHKLAPSYRHLGMSELANDLNTIENNKNSGELRSLVARVSSSTKIVLRDFEKLMASSA